MSEQRVCAKCGQAAPASGRGGARYRDQKGNAYCAACAGRLKESGAQKRAAPTAETATLGVGDDGYALAEEGAGRSDSGRAQKGNQLIPCPGCGGTLLRTAVLCTKCGFNLATGQRAAGAAKEESAGTKPKRPLSVRDDVHREHRAAYIKSIVIAAICLPLSMAILALISGDPTSIVLGLAIFGVMFVVTCVVYLVCAIAWIGFDEPLGLEGLRLLAVCSITEIFRSLASPLPPNLRVQGVAQFLIGCVFVGALMTLMEMEKEDAILFAIITAGVRIVLGIVLLRYAIDQGWIATA